MINKVKKRDNSIEKFNEKRIYNVINKAFIQNNIENKEIINSIYNQVLNEISLLPDEIVEIEKIQNIIQKTILKNEYYNIGVEFIKYREEHRKIRESKIGLYESIGSICKITDRENANVGNGPSSKMLQIAEATSKEFYNGYIVDKEVLKLKQENKIYDHDSSWGPIGTTTCTFIPGRKLLHNGFNTGHGFIRSPKRIKTAASLLCIMLQANQNDQHGGQAFGWFDRDSVEGVKNEYEWQIMNIISTLIFAGYEECEDIDSNIIFSLDYKNYNKDLDLDDNCDQLIYSERNIIEEEYNKIKKICFNILESLPIKKKERIQNLAWVNTDRECFQAMESVIFNFNSMHSRAGAQVPFSSLNIGTDTTKEGRMVCKNILLAYEKGLGKGEQPIFPNIIFKVKSGINYEPNTPNFDLLLLALRVSSKRLFPTFNFQDCTLNKDFPEDIPIMGCRTRVGYNRHSKKQTCKGRGNLSFTTINLPNISLELKYKKKDLSDETIILEFNILKDKYDINIKDDLFLKHFFIKFNKLANATIEQLVSRFKYQCSFKKKDFPFLLSGIWMDSESLEEDDTLYEVLKHGTLGVGFIGLAECLYCLIGKHHGEDKDANELGHEIVSFLYKKCNEASDIYNLNFGVIGTPAEGLCGKLVEKDKQIYGVIEGVTDKEWYTNSFHVPVEYSIDIFEKIKIEGAYSKYCAGGSITYVELDESPLGNIDAYYKIIQYMYESDVAYGAINFPCDRCKDCGHFGVIPNECPVCHSKKISRVRRITGYLAEEDQFNFAKRKEEQSRKKHLKLKRYDNN